MRVIAALLGTPDHGRWLIAPAASDVRTTRSYRGDTLILETRFETAGGAVLLVDFMPPRQGNSAVERLVRGERGQVMMRTELIIRFGYGALVPWVYRQTDSSLRAVGGPDQVVLRTPAVLRVQELKTMGAFSVGAGLASSVDGWARQQAFLAHLAKIWSEPRYLGDSRGSETLYV
jgi:Domain of unknown function (DUF5911)